ncbi:MAG: helix-turn-helix domain-containing protein [Clostridia bacterium]|nr:helix-turn-helix domain-containing protein [Clostridia bacterium]
METLEKICDALQCKITNVIELTEDPQKENE